MRYIISVAFMWYSLTVLFIAYTGEEKPEKCSRLFDRRERSWNLFGSYGAQFVPFLRYHEEDSVTHRSVALSAKKSETVQADYNKRIFIIWHLSSGYNLDLHYLFILHSIIAWEIV